MAYETLFLPNIVKLKAIIQGKTEQKYGKIYKNGNFTFSENRKINLTQFGESRTSRIEPIGTKQKGPKITKITKISNISAIPPYFDGPY